MISFELLVHVFNYCGPITMVIGLSHLLDHLGRIHDVELLKGTREVCRDLVFVWIKIKN